MFDLPASSDPPASDARGPSASAGSVLWKDLVEGRRRVVASARRDGRQLWLVEARHPSEHERAALTSRERVVVTLLLSGQPTKLPAFELGCGRATVYRVLDAALAKLGIGSRHELIMLHAGLHRLDRENEQP